ncbi:MAG: acyl carrier protein [Alphaproteobacteria bacterium]|nr:acyl carrier protein [Alphaproteobacteria bacterium]
MTKVSTTHNAGPVRDYITANFLFGNDSGISDEKSLLEAGVLDSTGVMELVAFLEERFAITIRDEDLVPENLDSIRQIAALVDRRLAG